MGGFGAFEDEELSKPRRRGRWLKRSLLLLVVLGVIGGGLYGAYRWTQTQYYVGVKGDHAAIYQGIEQKLAWVNLSKVHEDRPGIELKYLPQNQRKYVTATIAASGLGDARRTADELEHQAKVCQTKEAIDKSKAAAAEKAKKDEQKGADTATGKTTGSPSPDASGSPKPGTTPPPARRPAPPSPTRTSRWPNSAPAAASEQEGRQSSMSVVTNTTTITSVGAPSRRNTELALLVFAVLIPVFAYANVGLAKKGTLPAGMLAYGLGLGAIAVVAHLVVRKFAPYADPDAADRHPAERHGPGVHLAAGPGAQAPRRRLGADAADVVDAGRRALPRRPGLPQGPPHPAALHLHLDGRGAGPADPPGVLPAGLRRADLDHHRGHVHPAR